jgi:hypothetical protein
LTQWVASYFYRSMGRETWTLWGCLALLDWWWPWILWISSGTSLHCFMFSNGRLHDASYDVCLYLQGIYTWSLHDASYDVCFYLHVLETLKNVIDYLAYLDYHFLFRV